MSIYLDSKNINGPPMAKNIYGRQMAKNTFSFSEITIVFLVDDGKLKKWHQ